jgi:hypothetical protein
MTPETKLHLTFRQRGPEASGEPGRGAGAGAPEPGPAPDEPVGTEPNGVVTGGAETSDETTGSHSRLADSVAETAESLRRTYRSPHPAAGSERIAGVCLWALLLVLGGAVAYLRALLAQLAGAGPGLGITSFGGLVGLGLTIAAFLTIGKRRTPWILLGLATAVLFTLLVLGTV